MRGADFNKGGRFMIAKTEVKEVGIYRRSATVYRAGVAKLEAGRNMLYVSGMTKTADTGTFLLKFPPNVKAANMQIVSLDDAIPAEEKESERIKKRVADLAYQIDTCNYMAELKKSNANFSYRTNITLSEQQEYMDKLPEQLLALHKEVKELTEMQEVLGKELDEVAKDEAKPLILAEVTVDEACEVPFLLQYQETAGSWAPKYEVRFAGVTEPLSVSMKARIRQSSGEDWKQAKVTLYSGNPVATDKIPELQSLQLSFYEPPRPVMQAPPMNAFMGMAAASMAAGGAQMMQAAAAPMMDMNAMKMMSAMQTEEATVSEEESMTAFELPGFRDILSDTSGNLADLKNFTVDAKYHVLCIPKVSDKCFMTAEIVSTDWPLQPAKASVYLKDIFAGEFYINPNSDTDTFNLSLGNDERLTVVRTDLPRKTQEALLKNQKKQMRASRISLVNNSSESVDVLIIDQLPISTEKNIVVEKLVISDAAYNEETGELRWEIKAEPKKEVVLNISYSVAWPKDKQLSERHVKMKSVSSGSSDISDSGEGRTCKCGQRGVTGKFCPSCGAVMEARG